MTPENLSILSNTPAAASSSQTLAASQWSKAPKQPYRLYENIESHKITTALARSTVTSEQFMNWCITCFVCSQVLTAIHRLHPSAALEKCGTLNHYTRTPIRTFFHISAMSEISSERNLTFLHIDTTAVLTRLMECTTMSTPLDHRHHSYVPSP
jgi:hypothetical protein